MPRARTSTRPLFQRRQYEYIADVLRGYRSDALVTGVPASEVDVLISLLSRRLAETNPAFNRARFERACGITR